MPPAASAEPGRPPAGGVARFLAGAPPAPNGPPASDPLLGAAALRDLAAAFYSPPRPNARAVAAALGGASTGPDLWEALVARGELPASWLGGVARAFAGRVRYLPERPLAADVSTEPSLAHAAALAADPDGVAEAERLSAEFASRLAAFVPRRYARALRAGPALTAWEVAAGPAVRFTPQSNMLPHLGDRLVELTRQVKDGPLMARAAGRALVRLRRGLAAAGRAQLGVAVGDALAFNAFRVVEAAASYDFAQRAGWRAPGSWPEHLRGLPFADLPSPFAPLLGVYRRGYALRGFLDDAISQPILLAPLFEYLAADAPAQSAAPGLARGPGGGGGRGHG